jgi:hypothetical protein
LAERDFVEGLLSSDELDQLELSDVEVEVDGYLCRRFMARRR